MSIESESSLPIYEWKVYSAVGNEPAGMSYEVHRSAPPFWRLTINDVPALKATPEGLASAGPGAWPQWPRWLPDIDESDEGLMAYGGRASGWPLLAMRSYERVQDPGKVELSWAWRWRDPLPRRADAGDGTVPLQPVPIGFAVNAALFSTAWWLLLFAPLTLRGWWRRRRNSCVRCGYSRESLASTTPCPECGEVMP
jgi:hypothetical protein